METINESIGFGTICKVDGDSGMVSQDIIARASTAKMEVVVRQDGKFMTEQTATLELI